MTLPIAQLLALQTVDQHVRHLEQELQVLRLQVKDLAEEQAALAQEVHRQQQSLADGEGRLQHKEKELVQVEERIRQRYLYLQQPGREKEFLVIQQEAKVLEEYQVRLQEEISALRGQIEEEREELRRVQDKEAALQIQVMAETAWLQGQIVTLRRGIRQERHKHQGLAAGLEAPMLQEYEKIFTRREGAAVAELHAQTCQGCHMRLPLQKCYQIQASHDLAFCPYCHCILYCSSPEPSVTRSAPINQGSIKRKARGDSVAKLRSSPGPGAPSSRCDPLHPSKRNSGN